MGCWGQRRLCGLVFVSYVDASEESEGLEEISALPRYSLSTNASLVIPQTQAKLYFSAGGFKRFAGLR